MPRLALRPLTLIAILALMAVVVGAQAPVPTNEDQETAKTVVDLLEKGHMARPVIDDEIAVKWGKNFLKDLDPQKFYFLKADVEEFKKDAKNLDDQVREGNIDFAPASSSASFSGTTSGSPPCRACSSRSLTSRSTSTSTTTRRRSITRWTRRKPM